jgi:hypothetical protein
MNSPEASTRSAGSSGAPDSRRMLVARVIASSVFAKSERLSSLLVYICDIALNGREDEISEQSIGTAVFRRSPDFDSSIDGIVRTQASRLRQKLDQYFEEEGAEEPVRIVIPKGGYVPFFVPQPVHDAPRHETAPSLLIAPPATPLTVSQEELANLLGKVAPSKLPGRSPRYWLPHCFLYFCTTEASYARRNWAGLNHIHFGACYFLRSAAL